VFAAISIRPDLIRKIIIIHDIARRDDDFAISNILSESRKKKPKILSIDRAISIEELKINTYWAFLKRTKLSGGYLFKKNLNKPFIILSSHYKFLYIFS